MSCANDILLILCLRPVDIMMIQHAEPQTALNEGLQPSGLVLECFDIVEYILTSTAEGTHYTRQTAFR